LIRTSKLKFSFQGVDNGKNDGQSNKHIAFLIFPTIYTVRPPLIWWGSGARRFHDSHTSAFVVLTERELTSTIIMSHKLKYSLWLKKWDQWQLHGVCSPPLLCCWHGIVRVFIASGLSGDWGFPSPTLFKFCFSKMFLITLKTILL
jgi:hypothetical protein